MNDTPNANKLTVCIFGRCNSGKSALFNAITGTDAAIVSEVPGTTTDPVIKSMELLPHGPVVLIDTAGINDDGVLGGERIKKTRAMLNRADFALYATDQHTDTADFLYLKDEFQKKKIPYIIVYTKSDLPDAAQTTDLNPDAISVCVSDQASIDRLKRRMADALDSISRSRVQQGLLQGLLPPKSAVVLVIPIDSEAPKGRLILPQAQLIRECLDRDIRCTVTTPVSFKDVLADTSKIDLVITDAQAFKEVAAVVPPDIPLTSFSMLMARRKGDIAELIRGTRAIQRLRDHDKILIAETCVHSTGHEDIGKVKIPALLKTATGKALDFHFISGRDYPDNLDEFALIVHCGGCMITEKEMTNRIADAVAARTPITNYGMVLAYCNGILERSIAFITIGVSISDTI